VKKVPHSLVCLTLIFTGALLFSFCIGKYPVSPAELAGALWAKARGAKLSGALEAVIFHVRLPRVLAAALVGAALAAAGTAYQCLFNNPLVSPDVLGASAGAGFGAALGILRGASYAGISVSAFAFGLAPVIAALAVSSRSRANPTLALVLAGIMAGSLFSAATSYLKLIADPTNALPAITYWLMGSLAGVRLRDLTFAILPVGTGLAVLFLCRWQLNIMTQGEDEARALGINTRAVRVAVVAGATLASAACVSISGMIGWVGLVVPHFARSFTGQDNRAALPAAMLLGASFLLVVDTAARTIAAHEVPIGILTAFVGAPFFVYLILQRGNRT
jgi:iron complex transport system permease protein